MKVSTIFSDRTKPIVACLASKSCLAAVLVVPFMFSLDLPICQAQQPDSDVQGAQVVTRGPVHEAFAGIVTFNPTPGIVVAKAPPGLIEEIPPDEKPEGDNVTWIPGYWAWDDERSDFLWVSGTWRALPPGRQWMAGYWGNTTQGYQWTSGYWADAAARETTYLAPPPATVEVGPNVAAPSVDYGWSPGCWIWYQGRYAWRTGYWAQGRADWDWMPAHYVWTPRGCIFVGGFWDYPVERRGVLFAPVCFESGLYSRRGYHYSPTIAIELSVFSDHLFLRPSYNHYYFGDYYAPSYHQEGFYASFSFQSSRYGYDPVYSHQRWEHRQDREWEHRVETSYQYRRDNEPARPPRTWAAQKTINPGTPEYKQNRVQMAAPIAQLAARKDSPMRFQPVASAEKQNLAQRGQEVLKSTEQRRTLEARALNTPSAKPGLVLQPTKVNLPRSPIVAKPANQLAKNQAPPTPQRAPKPDLKVQPVPPSSARQPNIAGSKPQSELKPIPGRNEAALPAGQGGLPHSQKAVFAPLPPKVEKPVSSTQRSIAPAPKYRDAPSQKYNPVPAAGTINHEPKPQGNHPAPAKDSVGQNANQHGENLAKSARPLESNTRQLTAPPPPTAKPAVPPAGE